MLDIDLFMEQSVEVRVCGKTVHMKQPTVLIWEKVKKLEEDLNADNALEKRVETAVLLLNNNTDGVKFKADQLKNLSGVALEKIITEATKVSAMAEADPN